MPKISNDIILLVYNGEYFNNSYIYSYNPSKNSINLLYTLNNSKNDLLQEGQLLIFEKQSLQCNKFVFYNPKTNEFVQQTLGKTQCGGIPVELKPGKLLIIGGDKKTGFFSIERSNTINIVEI